MENCTGRVSYNVSLLSVASQRILVRVLLFPSIFLDVSLLLNARWAVWCLIQELTACSSRHIDRTHTYITRFSHLLSIICKCEILLKPEQSTSGLFYAKCFLKHMDSSPNAAGKKQVNQPHWFFSLFISIYRSQQNSPPHHPYCIEHIRSALAWSQYTDRFAP